MSEMENTTSTKRDLKKHYLDRLYSTKGKPTYDYHKRKMRIGLHEQFDEVWVKYNNGLATYREWEHSLNKWLTMEQI